MNECGGRHDLLVSKTSDLSEFSSQLDLSQRGLDTASPQLQLAGRVALVRLFRGVVEASRSSEQRSELREVRVPPLGVHLLHAHATDLERIPRPTAV